MYTLTCTLHLAFELDVADPAYILLCKAPMLLSPHINLPWLVCYPSVFFALLYSFYDALCAQMEGGNAALLRRSVVKEACHGQCVKR